MTTTSDRPGLNELHRVALEPAGEIRLRQALAGASGSPPWVARKSVEAREVLALAQIAPRLRVLGLDADAHLLVMLRLEVPVPTRAGPDAPVLVAEEAVIAIQYPERVLYNAVPGHSLVQVRAPLGVFHPNVSSPATAQRVCLGVAFPVSVPVRELIVGTFAALSMQAVMPDPRDPAGIMNPAAAEYWLANRERMPLTTVPFLESGDSR
jgi:hypothetical protein